MSDKEISDY